MDIIIKYVQKSSAKYLRISFELQQLWKDGIFPIDGTLAIASGEIARIVTEWALIAYLVVLYLVHSPSAQLLLRLGSAIGKILIRSPRPILAVPGNPSLLNRILLAYDRNLKSNEALYLVTYMASCWSFKVHVLIVNENNKVALRPWIRFINTFWIMA